MEKFDENFAESVTKGVIKAVMRTLCGGEDGLQESLDRGDVWITKDPKGAERYFSNDCKAVERHGVKNKSTLNMGTKKLQAGQAKELKRLLDSFDWSVAPSTAEIAVIAKQPNPPLQPSTKATMQLATCKLEKVVKAARTLWRTLEDTSHDNEYKTFYIFHMCM